MSRTNLPTRYDRFGWDYELFNPLNEDEVAWCRRWAGQSGGPILILACGTARLACRLAQEDFAVTGLDLSAKMLSLARKNIARLPAKARRRINLVRGDMTDFDLGKTFNLIVIPDNSFREVGTRKGLLATVKCIRRHCGPQSFLLIAERRHKPSEFNDSLRSFDWSPPVVNPEIGELVSRRGYTRLSKDQKRLTGKFIYKTTHPDGRETIVECPWSVPFLQVSEYLDLFRKAGFAPQVISGYTDQPDDGESGVVCFVCRQREGS